MTDDERRQQLDDILSDDLRSAQEQSKGELGDILGRAMDRKDPATGKSFNDRYPFGGFVEIGPGEEIPVMQDPIKEYPEHPDMDDVFEYFASRPATMATFETAFGQWGDAMDVLCMHYKIRTNGDALNFLTKWKKQHGDLPSDGDGAYDPDDGLPRDDDGEEGQPLYE